MSKKMLIPRLSLSDTVLLVFSVLILFMQPLKTAVYYFSYIDELIILVCLFSYIYSVLIKKKHTKTESRIILFLLLFLFIGFISNVTSGIERSLSAIFTDVLSYSKFALVSLGGLILFKNRRNTNAIFSVVVSLVRLIVIVGVTLAIANQFTNLGMRDDYRYGIYCFKYIYDSAAILSWYCYMFLIVLSIDLIRGVTTKKKIYIFLNMVMWILTGRSRGFAFMAVYLMLVFILRMNEMRKKQMKIRLRYFVVLGVLAIAIAWNQIVFYFTTENQARNILLTVGFRLLKRFFPLGAGLGTFGTSAAQKFYSPIYSMYGISSVYGFTADNPLYLTDTFWPAVMGETGLLGVIVYCFLLYYVFKRLYKNIALNNTSRFIMIFVIISLMGSSIATSVFAQNATIGDVFFLCMIPAIVGENKKHGEDT